MTQLLEKITTADDTAPGQLVHAGLEGESGKAPLTYSRMPITVSMHELVVAWSEGLINDAAYIFFALKIERVGNEGMEDFNVTKFCEDWVGYGKGDKEKRLKEPVVTSYVQKMQQLGAAEVAITMQLSLNV